ncbi:MAG: LuxR C-terminal-related transcriptional regulator [Lachnospiraceae bacterium]|jgi:LuxR family maltose regulon positive regulatory protein|nr:LuxR C-terminal-related transcriptional regulator [Lachnospiraceae bacterium]
MLALLNDKYSLPHLPENCIPRTQLLSRFKEAAKDWLLYVSAPAGSGKTVSTLLWIDLSRRIPIWINLDIYDNEPAIFYKLFAAGLCMAQPHNLNMQKILTDTGFSSATVESTIRLITEWQPDGREFALVLEDFHAINNPEILHTLPLVLKRLSYSIKVILLSRNEFPKELMPFWDEGKVALISQNDLLFSEKEIRQYFAGSGIRLSNEEGEFAYAATGGFPIVVNALAKKGSSLPKHAGVAFGEFMREYLWDNWDESLKDFLLKTSLVDEMTEALVMLLTGRADSYALLLQLCAENIFVSRVGKDDYHYHHLFLDFLREIANEKGVYTDEMYKAAALYYLARKDYFIAGKYAFRSHDERTIIDVSYQILLYANPSFEEYLAYARTMNLETRMEELCERYPFLYCSHMYTAFLSGDAKTTEYYLDKLHAHKELILIKYPQFSEIAVMLLSLDYRRSALELSDAFNALPYINLHSSVQKGWSLTVQMPLLHRCNRDYMELADEALIEKYSDICAKLIRDQWAVAKPCVTSGVCFEQNRLESALEKALEAKSSISESTTGEFFFAVQCHLAVVYHALGETYKMNAAFNEIKKYIEDTDSGFLNRNFDAFRTRLLLFDADKNVATEFLSRWPIIDDAIPIYKLSQYFTTIRALIVLNQLEKAREFAVKIEKLAIEFRRPTATAEARVLLSILDWSMGKKNDAAKRLKTVLHDLQAKSYIRVVAGEGQAVIPILKKIIAGEFKAGTNKIIVSKASESELSEEMTIDKNFLMETLWSANQVARKQKGITAGFIQSAKPVKLSKQQRRMVELLACGYGNAKIAEITKLSIPTVKGHLMLAYEKLGVHNAADAVLKSRELGLLNIN